MDKINIIFNIIEKQNIIVEETNFKNKGIKGLYLNLVDLPPVIALDKSIIPYRNLYISILAEELGHHFTTQGNLLEESNNYNDKLIKNKKENLAKKWAANFLISDEEFVQALCNNISSRYDLCNYFNVTEEILQYKITSILNDEDRYKKIKEKLKCKEVQYEACAI